MLAANNATGAPASEPAAPEEVVDPATAPIRPGRECTIEINKDKMGLGLSIVGGCDTLLVSILSFNFIKYYMRCVIYLKLVNECLEK